MLIARVLPSGLLSLLLALESRTWHAWLRPTFFPYSSMTSWLATTLKCAITAMPGMQGCALRSSSHNSLPSVFLLLLNVKFSGALLLSPALLTWWLWLMQVVPGMRGCALCSSVHEQLAAARRQMLTLQHQQSKLKLSLAREQEVVVARDVDLAASRQRIRGLLAEAGRGAAAAGLGSGAGASQGAGPLASASGAPKRPLSMS
eukprot:scaffold45277_cov18-Tisochrysis_lutea.AAC.1